MSSNHSRRRVGRLVPRLSKFAVEHLLLLPLGAAVALVWANTGPESYYRFTYTIAFAVNDVAMAFFFAVLAKEVVEATAPGGVLHPWRRAALPMLAAPAVAAVPVLLFVVLVRSIGEPLLVRAWLVPSAIDLAVGYFILRVVFRPRHPVIPFFLLLGISADALALVALALAYPSEDVAGLRAIAMLALAVAVAAGMRRARVASFWPYVLVPGALAWWALHLGGVPPALALILVVPFLPHARRDPGFFVDAPADARDALNRFEIWCRYPAQAALFLFGLVNAGVPLQALEAGTWALPAANLSGKPLGLLIGIAIAVAAGFHLPRRVGWRELLVAALVAASGFTVALFVANGAMGPGQLLSETRMGVLLSLAGAPLALVAARMLHIGRFAHRGDFS